MSIMAREHMLLGGFENPVDDTQETFRVLLNAMASQGPDEFPAGVSAAATAVLLSLADFSTPLWIDPCLAHTGIQSYIGFHAGAPMARHSESCLFALIARNVDEINLHRFMPGTPDYPDRSTTVIIEVDGFDAAPAVRLTGPGIETATLFGAGPLPNGVWAELLSKAAMFPLGIDVILTAPDAIVAIPRSTRIEVL